MTQIFPGLPGIDANSRLIGYARVSTPDQRLDMQIDALKRAGCEEIFADHGISGAKGERPALCDALNALKPGDTLVVYKLDRLGRSVHHLAELLKRFETGGIHFCSLTEGISTATSGGKLVFHVFAAVAEFYRDLIVENTLCGLESARQRGSKLGRPYALDEEFLHDAHRFIFETGSNVTDAARRLGVPRSTLARGLDRLEANMAV